LQNFKRMRRNKGEELGAPKREELRANMKNNKTTR
jgi:hypothetical protein